MLRNTFVNIQKNKFSITIALVLILQLAVIIHYGKAKPNLFVDEIWSYSLANSYYDPFLYDAKQYLYEWLYSDFWNGVLTSRKEYLFSYGSVYYNYSLDNHPPLFGFLLHTICSFFPDSFSKWYGISLNIFFFIITQFILICIGKAISLRKYEIIFLILIYGSSWGAINNTIFIRMYTMLSCFVVAFVYAYILYLKDVQHRVFTKCLFALFCVAVCGYMTHFYMYIYCFIITLFSAIVLKIYKDYRSYIVLASTMIISVLFSYMLFPKAALVTLGLDRSYYVVSAPFSYILNQNVIDKLIVFTKMLSRDLFGQRMTLFLACTLILLLIWIFTQFSKFRIIKQEDNVEIKFERNKIGSIILNLDIIKAGMLNIIASSIVVYSIVSKISPYDENRYIYFLYPIVCLGIIYILHLISNIMVINSRMIVIVILSFMFLLNVSSYKSNNIKFYDNRTNVVHDIVIKKYAHLPLIMINHDTGWWPMVSQFLLARECYATYIVDDKHIERAINAIVNNPGKEEAALVFISYLSNIDKDKLYNEIKNKTGLINVKHLSDNFGQLLLFTK